MSSAPTEQHDEVAHGHHDPAAEIEHARHHAVENNWFFLTFFCVVGLAVLSYEFTANGPLEIAILALLRCGLIIGFLFPSSSASACWSSPSSSPPSSSPAWFISHVGLHPRQGRRPHHHQVRGPASLTCRSNFSIKSSFSRP